MIILLILKNEFKMLFKDRFAVLLLVVLPFIFIGLFSGALTSVLNKNRFTEQFSVAVVDNDDTSVSRLLVEQFKSSNRAADYISIVQTDEASALDLIRQNKVAGAIIIPKDFVDSVFDGRNDSLKFVANPAMRRTTDLVRGELESAANQASAGQSSLISVWHFMDQGGASREVVDKEFKAMIYQATLGALGRGALFEEETVSSLPSVTPVEYYTAGLLAIFASFLVLRGSGSMDEERRSGLKRRFQVSPVRGWQLLCSKVLFNFLIVTLQLLIVVLVSGAVFGVYLQGSTGALLLMLTATGFSLACWGLLVAVLSPTKQTGALICYAGTPLLALIGGNIYPLSSLPPLIQYTSKFTFNHWVMDGFIKVFAGNNYTAVLTDVWSLLLIGLVMLFLAVPVWGLVWRRA